MGHIPPGVNIYASARNAAAICVGAAQPQMFLATEGIADLLARNADIVRLAIFGHTHSDEIKLITAENTPPNSHAVIGVPVKVVPSITPINGNRPTFTLARINPATATLTDYTVMIASSRDGTDATWSPEYTFSSTYHKHSYDAASVAALTAAFRADEAAATPASQAYLRQYGPGEPSTLLQFAWAPYTCSMTYNSAKAVASCACSAIQ
jgi:sphingomyelin phosphodiesterase acid-like 3